MRVPHEPAVQPAPSVADVATSRANLRAALEQALDDPHRGVQLLALESLLQLDRAEVERRSRIA
jgi:hypothetical protein